MARRPCTHTSDTVTPLLDRYRSGYDRRELAPGIVRIGAGADKVVYSLPCKCHVLKIDVGYHSYGDQVRVEAETWTYASEELRQYLCPIDAYGNGWIVMARATIPSKSECFELSDELTEATRHLGLRDCHEDNVGLLNGRPVVIDYGIVEDPDDDDDEPDDESDDDDYASLAGAADGDEPDDEFERGDLDPYFVIVDLGHIQLDFEFAAAYAAAFELAA